MKSTRFSLIAAAFVAIFVSVAAFAGQVEIKLKDGSKWRGEVSDTVSLRYMQQGVDVPLDGKVLKIEPLYIVVEGIVAGAKKQVTIFRSDIASMRTTASADSSPDAASPKSADSTPKSDNSTSTTGKAADNTKAPGVFVLPMDGGVGSEFRHEEIQKLAEYIDKNYPPGQIIVLTINSNGGSSYETQLIGDTIRDLRKRHRVVAWIEKAISAGCQTAMYCNEIYFRTQGTAGSVTTWSGNFQAVRGEQLDRILEDFVSIAESNGYSKYIALSMKMNKYECSYDKDPVTGVVTFHGDLSGEFKLSTAEQNLCFNSSNALHCGFSDGTADTNEELAKFLDLPKWNEISDYGRRIAADWQRLCKQAAVELPLIANRLQYKNTSTGDPVVILGTRISLLNDAIRWWDRAPNICQSQGLPPKEILEREVAELKKNLADIKRNQR